MVPLADGTHYWHLYHRDVRVNGGISDTWLGAMQAAQHAIDWDYLVTRERG